MRNNEETIGPVFVTGGGTASECFSVVATADVPNLAAIMRNRTLVSPRADQFEAQAARFVPKVVLRIECEYEEDGRWLAEIPDLPGVMAYGESPAEARAAVQDLACRVIGDKLKHGEFAQAQVEFCTL